MSPNLSVNCVFRQVNLIFLAALAEKAVERNVPYRRSNRSKTVNAMVLLLLMMMMFYIPPPVEPARGNHPASRPSSEPESAAECDRAAAPSRTWP